MQTGTSTKQLSFGLNTLCVFRSLLDEDCIKHFIRFLEAVECADERKAHIYCEFVAALYENGGDFGGYLLKLLQCSNNTVAHIRAAGGTENAQMAESMRRELATISAAASANPDEIRKLAATVGLPQYASTVYNFAEEYDKCLAAIGTKGYGIFAQHHMFSLGVDSQIICVKNPDPQRIDQLRGYKRERQQVEDNTKALLQGIPASNILLYGDAGTGKSSTVKALANEYKDEGLRLVEVRKNQLYQIPRLLDELSQNPLKFIIFIDDLSFTAQDESFTALKAILEGSVSARPHNIVIYATSNRRHMMRESFSERAGEDVHRGDTLEEQTSLAARFGLTVTFLKPDRELYADIVVSLAKEYGVKTEEKELLVAAEAHAIRYGGRSPRTAKQFIELCLARQKLNDEQEV